MSSESWYHPTISSSVTLYSSPQPFPASGSFPMNQLFSSGGQSIGASSSASVLPMNTQGWFLQDGLVGSPCCPRDSQESSPALQFESINSVVLSLLYGPTLTFVHDYWKNHSFDYTDLCQQVIYLLFNMMSRVVIAFLPRSKHLLISWLQSLFAVILEPPKQNVTASCFSLLFAMKWQDPMPWS